MISKFNTYQNGLREGDLVFFINNCNSFLSKEEQGIVLNKKHLFNTDTRYGIRGFFEYSIYTKQKIKKVKTQNIKVLKIESTIKKTLGEK